MLDILCDGTPHHPIRYVGQEAILALLLDYDGTLSPIAPHPDLATMPPETKKVLERHMTIIMVIMLHEPRKLTEVSGLRALNHRSLGG